MAKSASNVAERTPVARKGSAGGEGHNGAALATVLIQEAEAKAKRETAEYKSLKERLTELSLLTFADHLEFRKAMVERQSQVEQAAKLVNMSISDYRKGNPESNTVYAQCSDWKTLSEACEMGFKPNLSFQWADIKGLAVAYIDTSNRNKAAKDKAPELVAERTKILANKRVSDEKRAELLAPVEAAITEAIKEVYKPRARTSAKKAKPTPAVAAASAVPGLIGIDATQGRINALITQLRNEPVPVVVAVFEWLMEFIGSDEFTKRQEAVSSVSTRSGRVLTPNQQASAKGVIGEAKPAAHTEETTASATASAGRRGTRAK